jgi:hypothetical protein
VEVFRYARGLVPLAAIGLLGVPGLPRPPAPDASMPPWEPPPCRDAGPPRIPRSGAAWFRLDPVLDASGTLAGQRLTLGVVGQVPRRIDLPPESFASGPVRGQVLVGDDDGLRSRLRIVDVGAGCGTEVAREASVIRGAILSTDLSAAWEHRVDRTTRVDLGVWRRATADGRAARALPGLAPDGRHGRTFSTELRLAADGRLAVASCGELACRTRVLDPATGMVRGVEDTGPLLGVDRDIVVAYAACPGLPCPIVAVDAATGGRDVLVDEAGPAAMSDGAEPVVVYERVGVLEELDLRTSVTSSVAASPGLMPVRGGSGAGEGVDLEGGSVLLAVDGRLTDPAGARRLDAASAAIGSIDEVQR